MKNCVLLLIVIMVFGSYSAVRAADYCSVTVTIQTPDGAPVDSSLIVYDESGAKFMEATAVRGVAHICDLGFGSYRIEIGNSKRCNHITFTNVTDRWPIEQKLIAVDVASCSGRPLVPSGCNISIRVRDNRTGKPIPLARLAAEQLSPILSDQYGRMFISMALQQQSRFTVEAEGYQSQVIELMCSRNSIVIRKEIDLELKDAR